MEPTYKVIECSFDMASFLLSEYEELEYRIVWVDIVNAIHHVYYIIHREGQAPEFVVIESNRFEEWYLKYSLCPELDEVIVENTRDVDGYIEHTILIVWAEPDEMEEVILQ